MPTQTHSSRSFTSRANAAISRLPATPIRRPTYTHSTERQIGLCALAIDAGGLDLIRELEGTTAVLRARTFLTTDDRSARVTILSDASVSATAGTAVATPSARVSAPRR